MRSPAAASSRFWSWRVRSRRTIALAGEDADAEFLAVEGLGDEVVGAGLDAADDVGLVGPAGEHEHVDIGRPRPTARIRLTSSSPDSSGISQSVMTMSKPPALKCSQAFSPSSAAVTEWPQPSSWRASEPG